MEKKVDNIFEFYSYDWVGRSALHYHKDRSFLLTLKIISFIAWK